MGHRPPRALPYAWRGTHDGDRCERLAAELVQELPRPYGEKDDTWALRTAGTVLGLIYADILPRRSARMRVSV